MSLDHWIIQQWNEEKINQYLRSHFLPYLKPDVSSYAKGRLRIWLNGQPKLHERDMSSANLDTSEASKFRIYLTDLLGWKGDWYLLTYSGEDASGISLHRDATPLSYEAYGINLTGRCKFTYHEQRRGYSSGPTGPTVVWNIDLLPGSVVHFNSKNPHAAIPSAGRWGVNIWRKK